MGMRIRPLLVRGLVDACLVGPDGLVPALKLVVGVRTASSRLDGEAAHHVREPTVHLDRGPRGEARAWRREEHDGVGDVLHVSDAAQGDQVPLRARPPST